MPRRLSRHQAIAHRLRKYRPTGLVLAVVSLVCACTVRIISGPTTVAIGDTVIYELAVSDSQGPDTTAVLVADVPEGWNLVSSTYTVVVDGEPVVAEGTVVTTTVCDSQLEAIPPGYQRLHIAGATFSNQSGTANLEFFADSQPAGEFELFFAFGGLETSICSHPIALTINREAGHFLQLIQSLFDGDPGVDGLGEPRQLAMAADGRHLYVASRADPSIAAFSRDPASGELSLLAADSGGFDELPGPRGLAITADGRHLYGASLSGSGNSGGVTAFLRDQAGGELLFFDSFIDSVDNIAISPDGDHVYAASNAINVYARDQDSGELSFVSTVFSGGGRLVMSPDGRHLYAASGTIDILARDEISGELTPVGVVTEADGVTQAVLSADGKHLYAAGDFAVTAFERDAMTGGLTFVESRNEITGTVVDPVELVALAISPDGSHVAVAGPEALSVFERHPGTGSLTFVDTYFANNLPVDGIPAAGSLSFSPDGRHLYAIHLDDDALVAFETAILFFDGFESGDLSKWSSATQP